MNYPTTLNTRWNDGATMAVPCEKKGGVYVRWTLCLIAFGNAMVLVFGYERTVYTKWTSISLPRAELPSYRYIPTARAYELAMAYSDWRHIRAFYHGKDIEKQVSRGLTPAPKLRDSQLCNLQQFPAKAD
jgi:hypothetical protein